MADRRRGRALRRRTAARPTPGPRPHRPAREPHPDLEQLRSRFRAPLEAAFAAALAALPQPDRNLLRLYYLDGLHARQIARMQNVHESTIARRTARVRTRLLDAIRTDLAARLALSPAELDSVLRAVRSELHLSLARLLR